MSPVARAGDRFSVCKDRQDLRLVKGTASMDCILYMSTPRQHAAMLAAQGGCLWCVPSMATARQPPTSPWRLPTPGVA